MSPVCVHFKQVKDDLPHRLPLVHSKLKTLSDIYNTDFLCSGQSKMLKKMPHKNVDSQPADHIHKTGSLGSRVRGQQVWASVSSTRNLFASLDQFGQTNLNHSHSNELIRKYTVWPLKPKYLHLLRSSPVQNRAQRTVSVLAHASVQTLLPLCSFNVELCHQPRPVSGVFSGSDPVCSRCCQQSPVGLLRTHSFRSGE